MKRFILHKIMGVLLATGFLMTWFVPAERAQAESEWVTLESEILEAESETVVEDPFATEHEQAAQLLTDNLTATGMTLNGDQRVYDFFGKFSVTDLNEISSWIMEKENESNISIRVFVAEMSMDMEKYFLEECADALCDNGYAKEDLAILLLNLDYYDRGVCIQGYGSCEISLSDDHIEYILDDIIAWFAADDYVYGIKLFAEEAAYYATATEKAESGTSGGSFRPVGGVSEVPYFKDNSFKGKLHRMPWPFLLIAPVAVAGVGIAFMMGNNGSKKTVNNKTYLEEDTSGLTAQKDDYISTSVSKTYSPVSSGSSGSRSGGRSSGGGGRSGGGRSHSGGSRRF